MNSLLRNRLESRESDEEHRPCVHKLKSSTMVNDNYCDCEVDGSDEPLTSACTHGEFVCVDHQRIPSPYVNDGICDCCDGGDEQNNVYLAQPCPNRCPHTRLVISEAVLPPVTDPSIQSYGYADILLIFTSGLLFLAIMTITFGKKIIAVCTTSKFKDG